MMMRKMVIPLILFCCGGTALKAQIWPVTAFRSISPKIRYDHMQYDYKVTLENVVVAQNVDSMYGHLVVDGSQFVDSNKLCLIAKNSTRYCKLDHIDKTAIVFSLDELSRKLKMPLINDPVKMVAITEELMNTQGQYVSLDQSSPVFYRLIFRFKEQQLSYAQLDFKKADSSLMAAFFRLEDETEPGTVSNYRRNYHIYNIRSTIRVNAFDLSRIFQMKDGQPVLSPKYARYTLIKIMQ